ncbi:MAG: hypothetical protein ACXV76_13495 [Halobacteriota archaeon]
MTSIKLTRLTLSVTLHDPGTVSLHGVTGSKRVTRWGSSQWMLLIWFMGVNTMITYEQAQELLGDMTIPKDSDLIEDYLKLLDDLVNTNGEQWVKDHRGLLADEWGYVQTLFEDEGKLLLEQAIKAGARKVHCFDGFSPAYYKLFGFRETSRVKWDERRAPELGL